MLPQGVTQLRIFEQRYLNMVKNSAETNGFVIVYAKDNSKLSEWGSWVDIIDFTTGSDGLLNITVKCKQLVTVKDTHYQEDRLMLGKVTAKEHWSNVSHNEQCELLSEQLEKLFNEHPELRKIYAETAFDLNHWVVARWLELLPIKFESKSHFAEANSFNRAVEFLTTIIFEKNDP